MIKDLANALLDLVYPPICPSCKNTLQARFSLGKLCPQCLNSLTFNKPPFCLKCSRHLTNPTKSPLCFDCRNLSPKFDFAWCICQYTPIMRRMIHQFKYNQKTYLRHVFRALIIDFLKQYDLDIKQFDYVIPIPLFPSRQRERGYNQSQILAEEICRYYHLTLNIHALKRQRYTHPQIDLKRKQRIENMTNAFIMPRPSLLKGKSVLLVDDLITTGATASNAAKALKTSGVDCVGFLALAGAF